MDDRQASLVRRLFDITCAVLDPYQERGLSAESMIRQGLRKFYETEYMNDGFSP